MFLFLKREGRGKRPTGVVSGQNVPFMFSNVMCIHRHIYLHMHGRVHTWVYFMWSNTSAFTHLHLTSHGLEQALGISDSSIIQVSAQMSLLWRTLSSLLWSIYCEHVPNLIPLHRCAFCNVTLHLLSSGSRVYFLPLPLDHSWPCKFTLTNNMQPQFQRISYRPQETVHASLDVWQCCPHINKPTLACWLMTDTWPSHLSNPASNQQASQLVSWSLSMPASHKLVSHLAHSHEWTRPRADMLGWDQQNCLAYPSIHEKY